MSEQEFWLTSPRFFQARLKGYNRRQEHEYELARWVSYWTMVASEKTKKGHPKNMQSLAKFPWEGKPKQESEAERQARMEQLEAACKKEWGENYKLKMYGRDSKTIH